MYHKTLSGYVNEIYAAVNYVAKHTPAQRHALKRAVHFHIFLLVMKLP
jgi:hypothetical protein